MGAFTPREFQRKTDSTVNKTFKTKLSIRERNRAYHLDNKEARNKYFRDRGQLIRLRRYGLSIEQFHEMVGSQNGKCGICGSKFKDSKDTHVDHCHKTKKIRGILCFLCNHGLGRFKDNPDLLERAASYLRNTGG